MIHGEFFTIEKMQASVKSKVGSDAVEGVDYYTYQFAGLWFWSDSPWSEYMTDD